MDLLRSALVLAPFLVGAAGPAAMAANCVASASTPSPDSSVSYISLCDDMRLTAEEIKQLEGAFSGGDGSAAARIADHYRSLGDEAQWLYWIRQAVRAGDLRGRANLIFWMVYQAPNPDMAEAERLLKSFRDEVLSRESDDGGGLCLLYQWICQTRKDLEKKMQELDSHQ